MTKTFRNILFSLLVISLVCGCATKQSQQYKKIDKYLTTHFKQYDPTAKNCVLVLNEQACLSCVREFAEVMQGFVNVPNKYIVICAGGSMVDISPFVNNTTATNVYDDPKFSFTKEIYPTPAAIFMENDKIDTIVNISAYDLEKTLMFIKQ
ncbi:MAG: hypothetical protein LBO06_02190, partial [Bacteroidales bacterium]|nr:hypothetical protein [Bacteroidales bacterium]